MTLPAAVLMLLASGLYHPAPEAVELTRMEVLSVAYAASGGDVEFAVEAVAVGECESGDEAVGLWLDATALNLNEYGVHIGGWQVNPRWWGPVPGDPFGQARQVYTIWLEHDWGPWECAPQ